MNEQGRSRTWWQQHPSLATVGVATLALAIGALILGWHVMTSSAVGSGSAHAAAGDVLYFAVMAIVLLFATTLIVVQQRRS